MTQSIFDFDAIDNRGDKQSLSDFQGNVVLIVNTASACGFTPQYQGLQDLYERYKDQGLRVLAFPCNQFGKQEKGSDEEIRQFCDLNFNISFPLYQKIDVNGDNAHPLFQHLKHNARGLLNSESIKWNFTKFLCDRQGKVVRRFAPKTKPEALTEAIEALL